VEELGGLLSAHGVRVCAFLMGNDFAGEEFEQEVDALVRTCEAAERLGVPAVRVDMVLRGEGRNEGWFVRRCKEAVRTALAATSRVCIGVENHGLTSNNPEFLDRLFDEVDEARFGLTLDTGNFYWYGHPLEAVYGLVERYSGRVCHTHLKNISYPEELREVQRGADRCYAEHVCPIYCGDIDYGRVVSILRGAGYEGDLTVEDESLGKYPPAEQARVLEKDVEYLKGLL